MSKAKRDFNIEFGSALRGYRMLHGFKTAEAFIDACENKTGYHFPIDTLRRIESGRQTCTVEQFAAIELTCCGFVPGFLLGTVFNNLQPWQVESKGIKDAYSSGKEKTLALVEEWQELEDSLGVELFPVFDNDGSAQIYLTAEHADSGETDTEQTERR